MDQLEPVLLKGLTELARSKAAANQAEALQFLGLWLRDNNPNRLGAREKYCVALATNASAGQAHWLLCKFWSCSCR